MFTVAGRLAARRVRACSGRARHMATLGSYRVPETVNEPTLHYAPGSPERVALRAAVERLYGECPEIPCIVGGKEVRTGLVQRQVMPTEHGHAVCTFHEADTETMLAAADAAVAARKEWADMPIEGAFARAPPLPLVACAHYFTMARVRVCE